jgi:MoxR-like ATPase
MSQHPLIDSLVSGKLNEAMTEMADIIDEVPSEEIALPISADSSQLAAINAAAADKSFVLHGPPGTGK